MTEPAPSPPEAPQGPDDAELRAARRRRWRKMRWTVRIFVFLPGLFLVLGIFAVVVLPILLPKETLRAQIEETLASTLDVPVRLAKLDYHPLTGVHLENLRIGPPKGFERDVAFIRQVRVSYDVTDALRRRVVLREATVLGPTFVLEQKDGRRNIDVLLEKLASDSPDEPSALPDRTQPVSPIIIKAERVAIEDITLELAGDGPTAKVAGINVYLDGEVTPKIVRGHLEVGSRRADGRPGRLSATLPANTVEGFDREIHAKAELVLAAEADLSARADKGLTIERVEVSTEGGVRDLHVTSGRKLGPIALVGSARTLLEPSKDKLTISPVTARFGEREVLNAKLGFDGLMQILEDATDKTTTFVIGAQTGLQKRGRPGVIEGHLRGMQIELNAIEPFAELVVPGIDLDGGLGVSPVEVSGTFSELTSLNPRVLTGTFRMKDVGVRLDDLRVGPTSGQITGSLDEKTNGLRVEGNVVTRGVEAAGQGVRRLDVAIDAKTDTIELVPGVSPQEGLRMGLFDGSVVLTARNIKAGPSKVGKLVVTGRARGKELASPKREGLPPIALSFSARTASVAVGAGRDRIDVRGVSVSGGAAMDHLVRAADGPIEVNGSLQVDQTVVKSAEASVGGLRAKLALQTADPRHERPIDVRAKAEANIESVTHPKAELTSSSFRLDGAALRIPVLVPGAVSPMPRVVTASVGGRLAKILVKDPSIDQHETHAEMNATLVANPLAQRVDVKKAELRLDEFLRVIAKGTAKRVLTSKPHVQLDVDMLPLDFSRVVRRAPKKLLSEVPGLTATGTATGRVHVSGTIDTKNLNVDIRALPVKVDVRGNLDGVAVAVPSQQAKISGLDAQLRVKGRKARLQVDGSMALDELTKDTEAGTLAGRGLVASMAAGLRGKTWSIESRFDGKELSAGGTGVGVAKAASASMSMRYPTFGDLELLDMELNIPDSGVEASMKGRLTRRKYGALRPVLDMKARLDFARLKILVPPLAPLDGRFEAQMAVTSPEDQVIDSEGWIALDRFFLSNPDLRLENANGRVPFSQRVEVPAPAALEGRGLGALGDDFEAQLEALVTSMIDGWRIVVDGSNILEDSPQTADYEALRPYYTSNEARLTVDKVVLRNPTFEQITLEALSADTLYSSGVFRLDRLAFQLWEGDVFGDMSLQLANERDVRWRMRMTATDINLDLPTSKKLGIEPARGAERAYYLFSAVSDLKVDIGAKEINGNVDVTKLDHILVMRMVEAVDPEEKNAGLQASRIGVAATFEGVFGWLHGERIAGLQASINQNLLSQEFIFARPWFGFSAFFTRTRWVPQLIVPFYRAVQEGVGFTREKIFGYRGDFLSPRGGVPDIRRQNLSPVWAHPVWERVATQLAPLRGRVRVDSPTTGGGSAEGAP